MTRVAYVVSRYPAVSHTFITREVRALRELGVEVDTYSIHRTPQDQLLAPTDREEAAATRVLLPPTQRWVAEAQAAAARTSRRAFADVVAHAFELSRPGARGRALAASWTLEAAALWHACSATGTRHLHAHLNGTAPTVALLAARLGNAVDGGGWTWSMTVHGPSEFFDVEGEALPQKVHDATFVVCISDFARSQLMAFSDERDWDKLAIVHCGVDPDQFAAVPRHDRPGPLELLTVGRLTQVKGQAVALDALTRLTAWGIDARLTLVGDGPKRADLERIAGELGVTDLVRFEGAVGQDRIGAYFDRADVFVLSSFAEGVPVVLMEAMASELPVLAPGVMGVRELVHDGVNGRVLPPGRADEYAEAIADLAGSPGDRRRLGAAGRETVSAEFDIAKSAERLAALFAGYTVNGRGR